MIKYGLWSYHDHPGAHLSSLTNIRTKASPQVQAQAVKDLIGRLLDDRAKDFDVVIEPARPEEEKGFFEVRLNYYKSEIIPYFLKIRSPKKLEIVRCWLKDRRESLPLGGFIII